LMPMRVVSASRTPSGRSPASASGLASKWVWQAQYVQRTCEHGDQSRVQADEAGAIVHCPSGFSCALALTLGWSQPSHSA
jgi:hypothetical protein